MSAAPGWGPDNAPRTLRLRPLGKRVPRFDDIGRAAGQRNPLLRAFHVQPRK